jgi:cytochrome P450
LYLLAKAPWVRVDLERELDQTLAGQDALLEDLPRMPLLRAVVEETLRLYPPVPILPRQALQATRIGNLDVEKDALILISPWLLHRSPDLWDDPHAFRPDRFLPPRQPRPFSYIPFSAGPRLCPGMNFGLAEAALCLGTMMSRFRVDLEPGFVATPVCRLSLRPAEPVMVTLTPRRPE